MGFSKYPNQIDTAVELPVLIDLKSPVVAEVGNRYKDAILAIEGELGIQPSGVYGTVRQRLDALEAGLNSVVTTPGISEILEEGTVVDTNVTALNFIGSVVTASTTTIDGRVNITVTGTGDGGTLVQVQETKAVNSNGQTAFTLSLDPTDETAVKMFINGFKQQYGIDYTVSGTTVAYLDSSLPTVTTDDVEFWYIADGGTAVLTQVQESIAVSVLGQTLFSLSDSPVDTDAVEMYINGQKQVHGPSDDYTVSGSTVTYLGSLTLDPATDDVEFWYITSGVAAGGGGGGGGESFADTLAIGNITGGNNIVLSVGDSIQSAGTDVTINDNLIVNGKLTVTGLIDPTGVVYEQAAAPNTSATEGAVFVSDGSGSLVADTLYFRQASDGAIIALAGAGIDLSENLNATLALGNTTGTDATTSGNDIIFSGDGTTQDSISIGGISGRDFNISFASTASGSGGNISLTAQNAGGSSFGGDVLINTGDAGSGGTVGNLTVNLGNKNGGTRGKVYFQEVGINIAQIDPLLSGTSIALIFGEDGVSTTNNIIIAPDGATATGAGMNMTVSSSAGTGVNSNGGNLQLYGGGSTGSGTTGDVLVQAGAAGSATTGGNVTINATNGGSASGDGGIISITSGSGVGNGAGGDISFTAGTGVGNNNGGPITITGGDGGTGGSSGQGGSVGIDAGNAGSGSGADGGEVSLGAGRGDGAGLGGDITISSGVAGSSGNGGVLNVLSGNGGSASGAGGIINITSGSGVGNGEGGTINITSGIGVGNNNGGPITITGGDGGTGGASGQGGSIGIDAGNAGIGSGADGGEVSFGAGNGDGAGLGGDITITSGTAGSSGTGGIINILARGGGSSSGDGGSINITSGSANGGGEGGIITITAGIGVGNNNGGPITITGGDGGTGGSSGQGGSVGIDAGNAGTGSGANGGEISFSAGSGNGGGAGGDASISSGVAGTTGNGGTLTLIARDGGGTSGDGGIINITSGSANDGYGGAINITSGSSGTGSLGSGAPILITTGSALSSSGNGGSVFIFTGTGTGSGEDGYIQFNDIARISNFANEDVVSKNGVAESGMRIEHTLSVVSDNYTGVDRGAIVSQHNTGAQGTRIHLRKSRGDLANPAVVQAGDGLGRIEVWGYDGTNYIRPAYLDWEVDDRDTVGTDVIPVEFSIYTGSSAATKRITVRSDGYFELHNNTPIQWVFNSNEPTITQETSFGALNAHSLTIRSQSNTNAGAFNGGDLILSSGSSDNGNGGNVILKPGTGGITAGIVNISGAGATLQIDEISDHTVTESAGVGLLWVRNDSPNTLIFTDDTGIDHSLSNFPGNETIFGLSGIFSGASVPGTFDPPYVVMSDRVITKVKLIRRTAGTSGTTRVDILKNGTSIFASDPAKPQVSFSDGDNAINTVTTFATSDFAEDDIIDVELETVEAGSAEDLMVVIRFA